MAITLLIAGGPYSIKAGTLSIVETLGGRSTCEFSIDNPDGSITPPRVGQSVLIKDGVYTIFSGSIESIEATRYHGTFAGLFRVSCVDHHRILDRRITGERQWQNQSAGSILIDICTSWLGGEAVGLTFVQAGPTIEEFSVEYTPISEAIDELAKLASMRWYIDYGKELRFFAPLTSICPFEIEPGSLNFSGLTIQATREQYTNRAVAKVARLIRATQTAQFDANGRTGAGEDPLPWMVPDGYRRRWAVTYPLYDAPSIRVNSVSQTVGKFGQDQAQWYWREDSNEIVQDEMETALSSVDVLEIDYRGISEAVVTVDRDGEIARRGSVEGHTGLYETGMVEQEAMTQAVVEQKLEAMLDERSRLGAVVVIDTNSHIEPLAVTARVGQNIHVDADGYRVHWYDVQSVVYGAPCRIVIPDHGIATGEKVRLHNVPSLDGAWTVTRVDEDTLSLNGSSASGAYSGGGFAYPLTHLIRQIRTTDLPTGNAAVQIEAVSGHGAMEAVGFFRSLRASSGSAAGARTITLGGPSAQDLQIIVVDGASPLEQGNDLADNRYRVIVEQGAQLRLVEWAATLKSSGTARIRLMVSSDNGANWTSVFPAPGSVQINGAGASGTAFAAPTLQRGDLLRYDVVEADGSAGGLWLALRARKEAS
jgi:hypothetical protein